MAANYNYRENKFEKQSPARLYMQAELPVKSAILCELNG